MDKEEEIKQQLKQKVFRKSPRKSRERAQKSERGFAEMLKENREIKIKIKVVDDKLIAKQ